MTVPAPARRIALWIWLLPAFASAQGTPPPPGPDTGYYQDSTTGTYTEEVPDLLDGTLSAGGDLEEIDRPRGGRFRFPSGLQNWLQRKERWREEYGFSIGGSYQVLGQRYSDSLVDEENSVGQKFTLNLGLELANRGQPNSLEFDMAIEDRRPLETELPPLQAGIAAGSIVPTAATWGEFDLGITQAYLRQDLADNRFQWTVGKVFAPNYINAYPFFDDNRQFLSQTFSTSPTIASPLRGFGAVAAAYPYGYDNLYFLGGVYTARSDDTGFTADDFFSENERFYHIQVGRSALAGSGTPIQARGPMDTDNLSIDFWYRNSLEDGSPRAYGMAFNWNMLINGNLMPFLRGGWSNGWFVDRNLTAGVGWRPCVEYSDLFGIGVGWARPDNEFLDSQTTAEVFYRYHVTPQFAITPNAQVIFDPSLNPAEDSLWTMGLRFRIAF
ncbi:carbohydrate porin [Microbulbifer zhoushanensis]|uniref:carbohydrate porin n=1 Tax=Microbulbifer zhoushanensis TaxID=2904254 RepID=UPI001F38D50D|nr:carbohydrate porin [Microbulbifer zhoushanensis]